MNTNYQTWHKGPKFNTAIENYARTNALPQNEIIEAEELTYEIINEIKGSLQAKSLFVTSEHVGSAYEGLLAKGRLYKQHDMEFDVMLIWNLQTIVTLKSTRYDNYVLIKSQDFMPTGKYFNNDGYLSSDLVANEFFGKIQQSVNSMKFPQHVGLKIVLRKHGPAIQIDVKKPRLPEDINFTVDIIPALKLDNGEYYVPKQIKKDFEASLRPLTWRRSFSLSERNIFSRTVDDRKKLLRVLKCFRNKDATLGSLTSYHLKNIFLRVNSGVASNIEWSSEFLGQRLIDLISELEKCLRSRHLPCYFQQNVNLLETLSEITLLNLENRCKKLTNSEVALMRLLELGQ